MNDQRMPADGKDTAMSDIGDDIRGLFEPVWNSRLCRYGMRIGGIEFGTIDEAGQWLDEEGRRIMWEERHGGVKSYVLTR
jgi:hypothetical protein